MTMDLPSLRSVMSRAPRVVDALQDVRTTNAIMRQHGVRHLPVVNEGKLYGIVSERDLRGTLAVLESAPGELGPPVMAVCAREPLLVQMGAPLDTVAEQMANARVGSALVVDGDVLVGIVTTVDVCRELARLVRSLRPATA
jgi:acetoin utilization protein AcuB